MSYGTDPNPYGNQAPYDAGQAPYGGGPAPYPGGAAPYGAPNQFGQFGAPALPPDVAPLPGASFGEAIKRYFQRYAQFRGYASRSEFWWVALFNAIIGFVASLFIMAPLMAAMSAAMESSANGEVMTDPPAYSAGFLLILSLLSIYILATLLPNLGLAVRRLHDAGKSGAWLFIYFIPFGIGAIWLLILMASESRPDLYRPEWS